MEMRGTVVGIVGSTATGKTAVGIELAKMLNGEIISADSMAVYRGMDIGTAKPTVSEQAEAVFHLIDVAEPDEQFTVADFGSLSQSAIADVFSRGRIPLVVGGTGLYIKSITGEFNIPQAAPDYELREQLRSEASRLGNAHLLDRLRVIDSVTAERLHVNDLHRIIRAIEVHSVTGHPISHYHESAGSREVPYDVKLFGLSMQRETLYSRIEGRIDRQLSEGLICEVKALLERGLDRDLPSMKGLGYKQIAGYLMGDYDLSTAIDLFKRDTRRFAKRQLTWFRATPDIQWIDVENCNTGDAADVITLMIQKAG